MELGASLKQQIAELCHQPETSPSWMLSRFWTGLTAHYGKLVVGFACDVRGEPGRIQLTGLCDMDGNTVLPIREQFTPARDYPVIAADSLNLEQWSDVPALESCSNDAITGCFDRCRSMFLVDWLIDQPAHWYLLIMSPIDAPVGGRSDRALSFIANMLAVNLLRALDKKRLEEANRWIDRELDEISRLQHLLRPVDPHALNGVTIAVHAESYRYAGGDYFDLPRLTHLMSEQDRHEQHDHFGVMIADVAGHGPSAAVEAAMLDAILRTYSSQDVGNPEQLAEYVNKHMITQRPRTAFISAILCGFNPVNRELRHINAGHPPAMLIAAGDSRVQGLDSNVGIPLGVEKSTCWTMSVRKMNPGDILVLYTDGLLETRNRDQVHFGDARLRSAIESGSPEPEAMIQRVNESLDEFTNGHPVQDDQTMLVIRFD